MIGLVIVSHSLRLAEGVCELVRQVARGNVGVAAAGGTDDPENPIGTDAMKVLQAVESVYSEDGVLVLMDLGSAVLSAETALELMDEERRARVRLCAAPLVEGAVAAVSQAVAGAGLEEIIREARAALAGKETQLGDVNIKAAPSALAGGGEHSEEILVTIPNALGLHARPGAQLVRLARRFQAKVTLENITRQAGPAEASGINGILALGARQGHQLRIRARGNDARRALAELAAFIETGCGDKDGQAATTPLAPQAAEPGEGQLKGIPASGGIAIGPLVKLRLASVPVTAQTADDPEAERVRLLHAVREAQEETQALYKWAQAHAGENEAGIFDAQSLFLEDPALIGNALRLVAEERVRAESAWQAAAEHFGEQLEALDDPYLRARAADVADAAARVLRSLTGIKVAMPALRQPAILVAHHLAPSEVKELDREFVLGVCLETGSASAHSVILARAMGIPTVVGLGPGISSLSDGTTIALDGDRGVVWVAPGAGQMRTLEGRRQAWLAVRRAARMETKKPAYTRDRRRIRVLANISGVAEAAEAVECGAEGVGVLRTEFLFLGRTAPPGEEEQLAAYRSIAESLGGRPLGIRTLDIGGDKSLPYVEIGEEANPFLGWRGIRVTLSRRDLLRTQLRAILRAGAGHPVEVLFPMVSSLAELRAAKAVLGEVETELEREGAPYQKGIKVGVMIEVPAAVAVADQLAGEASFFSIGSNDLVQYAMAADRTNARVAGIADPFQPAVLRLIRQAIQAGRDAGIGVTLCGELAADLLATSLLIGLGLEEFSVSAPLIPDLKQAIGRWSLPDAEAVAREALALDSSEAVRRMLAGMLEAVPRA